MVDWMAIAAACGLTIAVGLGFVLWENFELRRAARERLRRRLAEPVFVHVPAGRRHGLDVRDRRDRAA